MIILLLHLVHVEPIKNIMEIVNYIVALLILIMDYEETSLTRYKKYEGDIKHTFIIIAKNQVI